MTLVNIRICSPEEEESLLLFLNNWSILENNKIQVVGISFTETIYILYAGYTERRERCLQWAVMSMEGLKCFSYMDVHVFP